MTSKIINMVERMKDEQDRALEALLSSAPIGDNGFTADVMGRIRRREWLRRLALPVAISLGSLLAVPPALRLLAMGRAMAADLGSNQLAAYASQGLSDLIPVAVLGVLALLALLAVPILED